MKDGTARRAAAEQTTVHAPTARLAFRGGVVGVLLPFSVLFVGALLLGVTGNAIPEAYWPVVILALFVGLVLVRDHHAYVDAVVAGVASPILALMLLAWFLAGILGRLLNESGLIEGLVWAASELNVEGTWFPLATFVIASSLSLSTGTSIGTILAATPILFPAGLALGADPRLLIGAIIGGAFVGDHVAPVSDTTIVSAYSQGTDVERAVRARLRTASAAWMAAALAYVLLAAFGSSSTNPRADAVDASPRGLIMLVVPAALAFMMVRGRHLVPAMMYSLALAIAVGLPAGLLQVSDLVTIDSDTFTAGGVFVTGIEGMVGVAVFAVFLMALVRTLEAGGLVDWFVVRVSRFATSARRAELSIVTSTLGLNALTGANTPSMVILGPFVRRLGHRFGIAAERRGNLFDACSNSIIGLLPYSVAVLLPLSIVSADVADADLSITTLDVIPYAFFCWTLMLTATVAAATGWGRSLSSRPEAAPRSMTSTSGRDPTPQPPTSAAGPDTARSDGRDGTRKGDPGALRPRSDSPTAADVRTEP
jgi:Na+/H+ antiporter NhaC